MIVSLIQWTKVIFGTREPVTSGSVSSGIQICDTGQAFRMTVE